MTICILQVVFCYNLNMTYEKFYQKISQPFRKKTQLLKTADRVLTIVFYICYPIFLGYLMIYRKDRIIISLLIPAIGLLLCTMIRKYLNFPRPYEKYQILPIIHKDTKGQSFPSRHVFSAVLISMAVGSVFPRTGEVLYILSLIEAFIRVAGGVHTPWDVLASVISATLYGLSFTAFR